MYCNLCTLSPSGPSQRLADMAEVGGVYEPGTEVRAIDFALSYISKLALKGVVEVKLQTSPKMVAVSHCFPVEAAVRSRESFISALLAALLAVSACSLSRLRYHRWSTCRRPVSRACRLRCVCSKLRCRFFLFLISYMVFTRGASEQLHDRCCFCNRNGSTIACILCL